MTSPDSNNPYQVPSADVTASGPSSGYSNQPHRVPAGNGMSWVSDAWTLFLKAPGPLVLITFLYGLISLVLPFIPLVGFLAPLPATVIMGGYYVVLDKLDHEGEARVEDLFAPFSTHLTPLLLLGLIMVGMSVLGTVIVMATGMNLMMGGIDHLSAGGLFAILMVVLLVILIILLVYFSVLYATILVVVGNQSVGEAMSNSFGAGVHNVLPFLVFSLVSLGIVVLASVPLFLGFLVATPVLFGANYMSFKDIFAKQ